VTTVLCCYCTVLYYAIRHSSVLYCMDAIMDRDLVHRQVSTPLSPLYWHCTVLYRVEERHMSQLSVDIMCTTHTVQCSAESRGLAVRMRWYATLIAVLHIQRCE